MRRVTQILAVLSLTLACLAAGSPAHAQFGKLKDKVKKKVEAKTDKKVDETLDSIGKDGQPAPAGESAPEAADAKAAPPPGGAGGTATAEDMTLYTKYDFVPGDKVIFYDDLSREEMGEFPSRWALDYGVFENAKVGGANWILCSDRGRIYPKMPVGPLPEKYTVEMEFFSNGGVKDGWLNLQWLDADNEKIGILTIAYSNMTELTILNKRLANKTIETLPKGKHVMRIMATRTSIKCYIDQERIANVPKVDGFAPVKFAVDENPYFEDNKAALIGAFRYAEGGKTLKEQLDEAGRIVTHGILFDSGSDRIKAESFKTLADIGGLLTDSPELKVSIEGHTDADGADAANVTLSQKRADAVKAYLVASYKIDSARLQAKGWGEAKPIDTNDTAEGKANNRRVELVKL